MSPATHSRRAAAGDLVAHEEKVTRGVGAVSSSHRRGKSCRAGRPRP
jgi:hypothetical protein